MEMEYYVPKEELKFNKSQRKELTQFEVRRDKLREELPGISPAAAAELLREEEKRKQAEDEARKNDKPKGEGA